MKSSAITKQQVATGMKIRDLGGPAELTKYLKTLGDNESRMDRIEPGITEATPGGRAAGLARGRQDRHRRPRHAQRHRNRVAAEAAAYVTKTLI